MRTYGHLEFDNPSHVQWALEHCNKFYYPQLESERLKGNEKGPTKIQEREMKGYMVHYICGRMVKISEWDEHWKICARIQNKCTDEERRQFNTRWPLMEEEIIHPSPLIVDRPSFKPKEDDEISVVCEGEVNTYPFEQATTTVPPWNQ